MNNTLVKAVAGVAVIACVGGAVAWKAGVFNNEFSDGGIDVSRTSCQDIAAARQSVTVELEQRKAGAQAEHEVAMNQISDAYWAENQRLEAAYHACISAALTADPCKEPFEKVNRLYEEIMAEFDNGNGTFNEAKVEEREQAKKDYNDCVENTQKPDFYDNKKAECDAALAAGKEANQQVRIAAEQNAQANHAQAVATANNAYMEKMAILDAIEKKCNEPGSKKNYAIGGLTTEGSGASIQSNSVACSGIFEGNDPDLRRRIQELESQLQKARAAGMSDGLFGTSHLQSALDELRQELKDSERTCTTDADCGNVEPVCCSTSQVGRVYCNAGVCANETTDCESPEICAGKPAQCLAPSEGVQQQEGVYISRTIPQQGACSQNLQVVNLEQANPESARYEITGNIPGWLHAAAPGGSLPAAVNVTYDCNTVQGFGPGTYTANGTITVYNSNSELINTIPFNVSITVEPVLIEVIEYQGKYLPVSEIHRFTGPECDEAEHWHANAGSVKALDGTVVPDSSECGYGKTSDVPVKHVPDTRS